jgi:hypothetical protein
VSGNPDYCRELALVLIKQPRRVDPVPHKRPAAEMMQEQVMRHGELKVRIRVSRRRHLQPANRLTRGSQDRTGFGDAALAWLRAHPILVRRDN